jgi:DNA anti-recombination protein RmuC
LAAQLTYVREAQDKVQDALRVLPSNVEEHLASTTTSMFGEFRSRLAAELNWVQQEATALRSRVEEGLLRRGTELTRDIEQRAEKLTEHLEAEGQAIGEIRSKELRSALTKQASELAIQLRQAQNTNMAEVAQLQTHLSQTLSQVDKDRQAILAVAENLTASMPKQLNTIKEEVLASIRELSKVELLWMRTEFESSRERAEQFMQRKEEEFTSKVQAHADELAQKTENFITEKLNERKQTFEQHTAAELQMADKRLLQAQQSLEAHLDELKKSGSQEITSFAAELSTRLADMVQKTEAEFRKNLETISADSRRTHEIEVHGAADRILNGVITRATTVGNDLARSSAAARTELDSLQRAHQGLAQKLTTAEQSFNQISEQFKAEMNHILATATEQMKRRAALACELVDEPLAKKVHECTKAIQEIIDGHIVELTARLARIERAVAESSEARVASVINSFQARVNSLASEATARCETAVANFLKTLARP